MPKKSPKKKKSTKPSGKKSVPAPVQEVRRQIPKVTVKLPNVWIITKKTAAIIYKYRGLFAGLTAVYGLLTLVLVQGLASSSADLASLKSNFDHAFSGNFKSLFSGLAIFTVLVGSAGNTNSQTAGAYQIFLLIITSLAVIWSLRQLMAGNLGIRVRDAFYKGMFPLVPFMLVLIVIGLQLLPLIIGASLYGLVVSNGIAVYAVEKILWGLLALGLALISLYFVSSSIFGLYIVTLADMTPIKALRSAKKLVKGKRALVVRKLLFLPVLLLLGAAIIMLPIILWLTSLAQWVFFILTMFGLVAVHSYIYTLYRELIGE